MVIWFLDSAAAAPAGAIIERALEIPAAIRTVARSFMRGPPYENTVPEVSPGRAVF
jgi:hypothetical protein